MENTIKLEVTLPMLNVLLAGLGKLPLDQSIETFTVVRQQAETQLQQAQKAAQDNQQVPVDTIRAPNVDVVG